MSLSTLGNVVMAQVLFFQLLNIKVQWFQLLHRNVQWFRGRRVFKAHRLAYHPPRACAGRDIALIELPVFSSSQTRTLSLHGS